MDSGPIVPATSHILREVRPSFSSDPGRGGGAFSSISVTAHESALRDYLRVLDKRKWVVLACLFIIPTLVGIASLRMTKLYDAVGRIAINKVDPVMVNLRDNAPQDYFDPTDMDTEVRILESDLLALEVIRQLNLDKRPDFGGLAASLPSRSGITLDPLTSDPGRVTSMLAQFRGGLHVAVEPNTRIIDIHYTSPDKVLAAQIVNTLATTYKEENYKTKFESTMQASDWLSKQLVDLQIKVETSQEKLVRYQKEHEILGTDEKQNIITSKLEELNRELTTAEGDRMQKEAAYRQVQSGDPASAAAAVAAGGNGTGSGSSQLEHLRGQEADLRIRVAEASTQFGPSYPKVAELNNQLKQLDTEIQGETAKVISGIRDQYEVALQREKLLEADFEEQKQQANKLNESAIEYSMLKRDLDTSRQLYEGLLEKMKEAGVTAGLRSNNFRIVDAARVPTAPSEPNIPRNLSFAFALALTSGIGLAFLLESLDNTVRTTEQAQHISQLPSLGLIPMGSRGEDSKGSRRLALTATKEAVELITQVRPQSQMAEAYRALRTSLLLSSLGSPPKIILVTSALPQEGKTTTSINTAIVLAQKGTKVLLVDADMRRPSVHKTLGMTGPVTGLSNVLTGTATAQDAISRSPQSPNLFVLPSGSPPPNPAELLASANMRSLLAQLREQYDHIVIDTPPTLSVTDAVVLSTRVDAVVLVIRSGQTTKTALRRSRDLLMQVNARVCGVLLNAVDLASPDYYYYYEYQEKYGGSYYRGEKTAEEETAPASSSGSI
jgi:succinoglycan biosynthesis transport protein ExoP